MIKNKTENQWHFAKFRPINKHPILLSSLLVDLPLTTRPTSLLTNHYYCKSTTQTQYKKSSLNHRPQRYIVKLNVKHPTKINKTNQHIVNKYQLIKEITRTDLISEIVSPTHSPQPSLQPLPTLQRYRETTDIDDFNNKLYGTKQIRSLLNFKFHKTNNVPLKQRYKQIRKSLLQYLHHLQKLKLTIKEFLQHQVFPTKPYEDSQSKQFFKLCKQGNDIEIIKILEINKYLVYEYDHLLMTALHWCAMRGLESTAKILLKYGADPDSQDIVGRTPLYLAFLHKQNSIAHILILNQADPWNKLNLNYEECVSENSQGKIMLHQTRRTHILLRMTPVDQRQFIWQKEQLQMYEHKKKSNY